MFVNKVGLQAGRLQRGVVAVSGCLQRKPCKKRSRMGLQGVRRNNFSHYFKKGLLMKKKKKNLDQNMQQCEIKHFV